MYETPVAGAFLLVATPRGCQRSPRRSGAPGPAVEWPSGSSTDGGRLAATGLRRGQIGLIRPGQPRRGGGKDLGAVLLQRHQVLQGVHPRVETGRNQTGEHTGNVGTVLRGKEQRVLALPDEELQRPLDQVVVQRGAGHG